MSFAEWSWRVRDLKPKPRGATLGILWMLGSRLDARTGCGWISRPLVAQDAGVEEKAVTAATKWALEHFLLRRLVRGHRLGGVAQSTDSLWVLADPTSCLSDIGNVPTSRQADIETASTSHGADVEASPNIPDSRPQHPMGGMLKRDQEERPDIKPSPARTYTGARVRAGAQARAGAREGNPFDGDRPDPALDLRAAQISTDHAAACRPRLTRDETRQHADFTRELIVHGHHDPALVAAALAGWRERRATGAQVGRREIERQLERIELAAAREQAGKTSSDGSSTWAVECGRCRRSHPWGQPCPD